MVWYLSILIDRARRSFLNETLWRYHTVSSGTRENNTSTVKSTKVSPQLSSNPQENIKGTVRYCTVVLSVLCLYSYIRAWSIKESVRIHSCIMYHGTNCVLDSAHNSHKNVFRYPIFEFVAHPVFKAYRKFSSTFYENVFSTKKV